MRIPSGLKAKNAKQLLAVVEVMLLGRRLDLAASRDTTLVRLVDLGTIVHLEGEVLDSHLIVPVDTAVRGAQPEALHARSRGSDLFGSSIREVPELLLEPERPKHAVVLRTHPQRR